MTNAIELHNLTKKFGKFTAVNDVSLTVEGGKIYGVVGPNGAGKTTLMSMIMGTLYPTSGSGTILGQPLASKGALKNLGYSPEFTSFYTDMSCMEYLWYMGEIGGLSSKDAMNRAAELIKKFNLEEFANKKVSKFSTGMKKKVSLAQAMIHNPSVLLLDEPTANLDPTSRMDILNTVRELVDNEHLTVLISSHVLTELETVIDHVIMIKSGQLLLDSPIDEAQKMFAQGMLNIVSSNNELIIEKLAGQYEVETDGNKLVISTDDMILLKKILIKIIYENNIILDSMTEEKLSLDSLYLKVFKSEVQQ